MQDVPLEQHMIYTDTIEEQVQLMRKRPIVEISFLPMVLHSLLGLQMLR